MLEMSQARRFDDLPEETKELLTTMSPEDARTLKKALPVLRHIISFGKVTKWLAIFALGLLGGIVMLGESITKILSWIRTP